MWEVAKGLHVYKWTRIPELWKHLSTDLEETGEDPYRFFIHLTIPQLQQQPSFKVESLELIDEGVSSQSLT
jgi:hypothetical protein